MAKHQQAKEWVPGKDTLARLKAKTRSANAFGELHRKALQIIEHRKRARIFADEMRLLNQQIHQRYMGGIW